jgi:hypothetical protein
MSRPLTPSSNPAIAAWHRILTQYEDQGATRSAAITAAVRQHPEAHRRYVAAYNMERGRRPPDFCGQ